MVGPLNRKPGSADPRLSGPTRRAAVGLILGAPLLGACSGSQISNPLASPQPEGPAGPQQQPLAVGAGQVKVGLILPLSAAGNAGVAAQSMKNAAEMALAEFQNPNIQLLIKDDGGSPQGAQQVTQQALGAADALFIADDGESVVATADALTGAGANLRNIQLLGTGLWDNPRVYASATLQGGLYAAPDPSGFRAFSGRYRTKYGADPVRTATLAYDAVALVAALSKQGSQRFAPETLTNPSGFAGIDGLFRFRSDGSNERGLAVMKVASGGSTPVAGSPKSFGA